MIMIDPIKPLAEGFMTEPASVLMDFFLRVLKTIEKLTLTDVRGVFV